VMARRRRVPHAHWAGPGRAADSERHFGAFTRRDGPCEHRDRCNNAFLGMGYWALVGWSVALPVVNCIGVWIASGWLPQLPKRETSVKPLLRFGILLTVNIIIVQIAYNLDKVLLGRFWGAEILGLYGRASQLTPMSSDLLMGAIGSVVFPALSRTQGDVANFENFLLKACKLTLTMAFPITVVCILFADDIVFVLLGPNWGQVAPVLKLLSRLI